MSPAQDDFAAPGSNELVLCAATVLQADFETRVKAARSAGYDAISLFPEHYLNARFRQKLSVADMQHMLKDNGIYVATIDPLLDWFGPGESTSEQLMYEAAHALDSPAINIATALLPDISREQVIAALVRICERAAQRGLNVDVEFLPWSVIPDLPTLLDIVTDSGCSNAFVTLDCLHFYRSGGLPDDLQTFGGEKLQRISNIQVCDIAATPRAQNWRQRLSTNKAMLGSGLNGIRTMGFKAMVDVAGKAHTIRDDASILMKEASCSRLLPGQGDIPLYDILQSLKQLDHQPLLGLEISSLSQNRLPPETAARQAMMAYRQLAD